MFGPRILVFSGQARDSVSLGACYHTSRILSAGWFGGMDRLCKLSAMLTAPQDFEEAEAYYSRSLHFRADDPSCWANRALSRLKLENPAGALADCEHALAINPKYMKAPAKLAQGSIAQHTSAQTSTH